MRIYEAVAALRLLTYMVLVLQFVKHTVIFIFFYNVKIRDMAAFRTSKARNEKFRARAYVCIFGMYISSQPTHVLYTKYYISVSE